MQLLHAYLLTIASLVVGATLSILEQDWQWFSRCGSLVVVIGILLTSTQILEELHLMRQRRWRHDHHPDSWSNHDWVDETESHKKIRQPENDSSGRGQGLYLLILGTLIWGFGDLIGRF